LKRYIAKQLQRILLLKKADRKGIKSKRILTILTAPKNLTVNALNKYLEIKARGML
jgi:hypothetical protein